MAGKSPPNGSPLGHAKATGLPMIRVERITPVKNRLVCSFAYDTALEPYFNSNTIHVGYDFDVETIPESVLSIPVLGLLAPVAWAARADVTAAEVDSRYVSSLRQVAGIMQGMYSGFKIPTGIHCVEVDTPWPEGGTSDCLLYSGGVDSTTSLLRNLGPSLTLASIRGAPDLRLWETDYWERVEGKLKPFVRGLGIEMHVIETDAMDVVNPEALDDALKHTPARGWWENLSHGLFLLSLCAPYTYVGKVKRMIIASSYSRAHNEPWGSSPASDESVGWGKVTTTHDSFDLTRAQKTKEILAPFMVEHPHVVQLRVCTGEREKRLASGALNCGACQKCARTELSLMWAGVDPAECGFPPPGFVEIKEGLISGRLRTENATTLRAIHASRSPPKPELAARYPGYPEFLSWFYDWEIPKGRKITRIMARLAPLGSGRRNLLDAILH